MNCAQEDVTSKGSVTKNRFPFSRDVKLYNTELMFEDELYFLTRGVKFLGVVGDW
jgi:hypothetical protein